MASTDHTPSPRPNLISLPGPGSGPLILELAGNVFEFVATPLNWWQAEDYCRQRFAWLPPATKERELAALGRWLQPHHLQGGIWLEDGDALLRRPIQRRE